MLLSSDVVCSFQIENYDHPNPIYSAIGPIRLLSLRNDLFKNDGGDTWKRVIKELPNHSEARMKFKAGEWAMFQKDVVDLIRSRCFLKVVKL